MLSQMASLVLNDYSLIIVSAFLGTLFVASAHICKICTFVSSSLYSSQTIRRNTTNPELKIKAADETNRTDSIEPLLDFDPWKVEPINYRPYKTSGHVSIGITKKSHNDWIRIDRLYFPRIQDRRRLIEQFPESIILTGPLVNSAIEELYSEIMINYLPRRYPTIFQLSGDRFHNRVTNSTYPACSLELSPDQMLRILGENVEDDLFFMCPDGNGEFRLQGCVACFPNGFMGPAHVGQSTREIHQPVPSYEERLGNGVDRFFRRMEPGTFFDRMNWSLQVDGPELFRTEGLNYYPDSDHTFGQDKINPDFDKCFLRVEHQTLTVLPRSGAIMFCVRSYMTPLAQIKHEGDGPKLAAAIESMPEKLGQYKMRQFWGGKILPWLKEELPSEGSSSTRSGCRSLVTL